jgi:hypothetical protein
VLGENPSFIPALHAAMASATDSGAQYALAVALYGCGQAIGRAALERIAADPASPRREKAARRLR